MSRPIADILREAKEAHIRYRDALPRMVPNGSGGVMRADGDPIAAAEALNDAFALRVEAEHADVVGDAVVWVQDSVTMPHYDLLAFYADQDVQLVAKEAEAVALVATTIAVPLVAVNKPPVRPFVTSRDLGDEVDLQS